VRASAGKRVAEYSRSGTICRIPWMSSYWSQPSYGSRFRLIALLGATGINVATRVMALIAASVGINFILTGIKRQLPGLTH
jgi:hypothetical protein